MGTLPFLPEKVNFIWKCELFFRKITLFLETERYSFGVFKAVRRKGELRTAIEKKDHRHSLETLVCTILHTLERYDRLWNQSSILLGTSYDGMYDENLKEGGSRSSTKSLQTTCGRSDTNSNQGVRGDSEGLRTTALT